MSVSHLSLLEQHRGTGPPGDQTASECQPGVWVLPRSPTNNSGLRSGAHDPERPGEVVAQRGCGWSGLVHPRDARVAGRNNSRAPINRLGSISQKPFLQHFRLLARFFKGLFKACVSRSITIGCGFYTFCGSLAGTPGECEVILASP